MPPLAVTFILRGQLATGILAAGAATLLGLAVAKSSTHAHTLLDLPVLLGLIAAANCCAVYWYGTPGIYWAYPLIFGFHIVLHRRTALLLNSVFLLALAPHVINFLSWTSSVPVLGSLVLTSVFAWLLASLVDRQRMSLEELVITDALTGAYNRHYFNVRNGKLAEQLNRHDRPASMIMFDIDHFKSINDTYGHQVGDRVLRILVDTVKARIRVVDEIFRVGGEEFAILLPDTLLDQASALAQVITDMVSDVRMIEGGKVSISCGVAELDRDEDTRSWLQRCDIALYEAKRNGRGRVCVAEPYDADKTERRVREGQMAPKTSNAG